MPIRDIPQRPTTLGELRASGWKSRSIKQELRENLLARLKSGEPTFPGLIGYDHTVIPQLENALLSSHDFILLGLRGQAKTRILRSLPGLLDEAVPVLAGSEVNDDPFAPISGWGRKQIKELGDEAPIAWLSRDERFREKLATPDVSIADLIGDLDPIKAATRRLSFDDEGSLHFGLLPRTHRGIVAINELPDLQARIQVGLLNILEEGDVQIRGFPLRFPLDILLVFSANPEDYTNRGRIITPLRDRLASQILTHYPRSLDEAKAITAQEARIHREPATNVVVPEFLVTLVEQVSFSARLSEFVDQASGVSARMTIALMETVVSNAERRAVKTGDAAVVARISDVFAATAAICGKVELVYEGEREGPASVARHLIGQAVKTVFDALLPDAYKGEGDEGAFGGVLRHFRAGGTMDVSDNLSEQDLHDQMKLIPGLAELVSEHLETVGQGELVSGMELVLEGLHQNSLLSKDELINSRVYKDPFDDMAKSLDR
ncbi:MAG: magnesium chelatase subunit I [Pseudohongiellaceae bacterium]|jgi:magnesium chelatase subunit I